MLNSAYISEIRDWLHTNLTKEKFVHSISTADTARIIARLYDYDEDKAYLAGLLHDCTKNFAIDRQVELLEERSFELVEGEKENGKILHAPSGAVFAKKFFNVEDEEILSAIRWHTLGRVNMTLLEKIIFLADKIEPATRGLEEYEEHMRALHKPNGLDKEILGCYSYTIKSLCDRGLKICSSTIEVYNNLLNFSK